jgi:hypothetical protein
MKGLVTFLLSSSGVQAQLSSSKIDSLLDFFSANQQRYQINVEQYCKFGDLPLMELTEYQCQDVIESSLVDGKTCAYQCKHNNALTGNIQCICANDDSVTTDGSNCKWKFPAYSSVCGLDRMRSVDKDLSDLQASNDNIVAKILGLNGLIDQSQLSIDNVNEQIQSNQALIHEKFTSAQAANNDAKSEAAAAIAKLESDLTLTLDSLVAADLTLGNTIQTNSDLASSLTNSVSNHAASLQKQGLDISENDRDITHLQTEIGQLDRDLDQQTGQLLTSLNNQILKTESDRYNLQLEIESNAQHAAEQDASLDWSISQLNTNLADEIAEGAARDAKLATHTTTFDNLNNKIQTNTNNIQANNGLISDKYDQLYNHTNVAINAKEALLTTQIEGLDTKLEDHKTLNGVRDQTLQANIDAANTALGVEVANGVARDGEITAIQADIVTINGATAGNTAAIDAVDQALNSGIDQMNLKLNITEVELSADIAAQEAAMILADVQLQADIDATNIHLNQTRNDLAEEVARGSARDTRLQGLQTNTDTLFSNVESINNDIDWTVDAMNANDTRMQGEIDANLADLTMANNMLAAELRAADQALNATDMQLESDLANTQADLDAEEAAGIVRDGTLANHEGRIVIAEADLINKQAQIDQTNVDLAEAEHTLEHSIENTDDAIRADMASMQDTLEDADHALEDMNTATNHRIDMTNTAVAAESSRNDKQDVELAMHENTLEDHEDDLDDLANDIAAVAANLASAGDSLGDEIGTVDTELAAQISALETAMKAADALLDGDIDTLEADLGTTNTNLDLEVQAGAGRDAVLADHESRITTLTSDTGINKAALDALEVQMNSNFTTVKNDLSTQSDGTMDAINALEAKLTAVDQTLMAEDVLIRGEMATDKLLLEQKIDTDVQDLDHTLRNHFNNEIYNMDTKFTTSINALSVKQQKDINDIHSALDFFWGVYRPSKLVLFEGVFQPEIGHLVTILPSVYRIWHLEVDIMPTGKNHYSWVNLLHFTASGDNYGRPGDRMPLISLYPGENKLHIACYVNNEVSYAYDNDYILPMHRWTKLEIGQTYVQSQFVYYVKLNGKQVYSVVNRYPRDFSNMMVYGCDPWSEKPNAKLRNLYFTTSWAPNVIPVLSPVGPYRALEDGKERSEGIEGVDSTGAPKTE